MVKLLVFAILLASSPASGLLEELFSTENSCYNGCHVNYAASKAHMDACTQGCDFKLHHEDCANQCKSKYSNEQEADSCQVGCTLGHAKTDVTPDKPILAVDPVPEIDPVVVETTTVVAEPQRPRSIIIIRLRQRPALDMPPMDNVFPNDPVQMFNDIVRRFQEKAKTFEDSIRTSIDEQSKDLPQMQPLVPLESIPTLIQRIPLIRISNNVRDDSSSESSEESGNGRSIINEMRHVMHHPRERLEPVQGRLQETWSNIRNQWNEFVRNQPRMPVWIFIGLLLSSSAILWYMLVSLCRHTPSYTPLSVRAQELVFYPYEHEGYEKEKIQPDGQLYDASEPLPIKVKLSNI